MSKKLMSDRFREAIETCGVSRHAIARAVGISDSVLSRFASGERGLTLATLDKLAQVLGLEVVVGVQKLPRPPRRGRKAAQEKRLSARMIAPQSDFQGLARNLAMLAHEDHFPSRRGVWSLADDDALEHLPHRDDYVCLYNNNPYAADPDRRGAELADFRELAKQDHIEEVAYATYPTDGEIAGYTYAMILRVGGAGPGDAVEVVASMMEEVLKRWDD